MLQRLIPALLAAGLFAAPALAQSNQGGRSTSGSNAGNSTASNPSPQDPAQVEQHIRQDLTKAGYTDVHVMPGSFLVQAKDSQGNQTQMMITPGGITAITALDQGNSGQGSSGQGSSGQGSSGQGNMSQGNMGQNRSNQGNGNNRQ